MSAKKKVDIEHFSRFLMPHSVRSRGDEIYFCVKKADLAKNRYTNDLYRYKDGKTKALTSLGDVGGFYLLEDGVVFAADRENKKGTAPLTILYKLPFDGGEAEPFLELDHKVTDIRFLSGDRFYFTAVSDPVWNHCLERAGGDEEAAAALYEEEKDYQVVDEMPFVTNAEGYTNGFRSELYYYESGTFTRLSGACEDCTMLSLAGDRLYFASKEVEGIAPYFNRLFVTDTCGGREEISVGRDASHLAVEEMTDGSLIVFAIVSEFYGINESQKIYRIKDGMVRKLNEGLLGPFGNSVGCDIKAGGRSYGRDHMVLGETIYRLDTKDESTVLCAVDAATGKVNRITKEVGNIGCVDLYQDGFVLCALRDGACELYKLSMDGREEQLTFLNKEVIDDYERTPYLPLSFVNEEGNEIRGWVVRPMDYREGTKVPAVLSVHGGPRTVFGPNYFHEIQLFAQMGYAVVFCNPTGSDGRGDSFADIRGRYGDRDFKDLMQFLDLAIEKNDFIDGERLLVTGGSYGGFMTNWIIGHTDRFKAAASQRSISNWTSHMLISDIGYYFSDDQTAADPWNDYGKFWDQSPLKYADKVTTPTLFIHSDCDFRCPLAEGQQMFAALRLHGIESRMCIFHGENHELSRSGLPGHRVRRLTEITDWFKRLVPPLAVSIAE